MKKELKKSWDEVTIETWQELSLIQSDNEATKFIEQLSIITDADPADLRKMKVSDFMKFRDQIDFVNKPPSPDICLKFEIDGKWYGMIPQFDFITTGEWLDAETWKDKPVENMHLYAALLYRPITKEEGDTWEIEEHKSRGFLERAELFRKRISISKVHGCVLFFSALGMEFIKILADYSQEDLQAMMRTGKMTTTQTHTKKQNSEPSKETGESTI